MSLLTIVIIGTTLIQSSLNVLVKTPFFSIDEKNFDQV